MVTAIEPLLREQLIDRRHKLEDAATGFQRPAELTRLLGEVDAALNRMEYLLTWNCAHIANAAVRGKIEETCRSAGLRAPIICTPEELMEP